MRIWYATESRQIELRALNSVCLEVPCFPCLFLDRLKLSHHHCKPETCSRLTEWILQEAAKKTIVTRPKLYLYILCPKCKSTNIVKCGRRIFDGILRQRYRCKKCFKTFTPRPGYKKRMKTRQEIVDYAKMLAAELDPAFSTRDIAKMIKKRFNVSVTHVTVANWLAKE